MDISLIRILSLIPKNENGKYKHGSKAEFARSIGYDSGDIISMWENGSSVSYKKKLHEIAAKYNVSVEWLKGETDDPSTGIKKEHPADSEALTETQRAAIDMIKSMSDSDLEMYVEILRTIKKKKAD